MVLIPFPIFLQIFDDFEPISKWIKLSGGKCKLQLLRLFEKYLICLYLCEQKNDSVSLH